MCALVIAEVSDGALSWAATASAVTAANRFGEVTVLVTGQEIGAAVNTAASIEGVSKVIAVDHPALAHGSAEALAATIVRHAEGVLHIVATTTMQSRNVLPRAAALLDVMVIPDVVEIVDQQTFVRPIYAGNVLQTVRSADRIKIVLVRQSRFEPAAQGGSATIEHACWSGANSATQWIEDRVSKSDRPELGSAKIVVAGGRGVGSKANFAILDQLAQKLRGALGASRAAVDAGYAPNDWQIGQTGRIVAPDLYVAVGISGAIQHLAGMKESGTVVAVNTDPDAPIFKVADYGLVGDFSAVLPELIEKL